MKYEAIIPGAGETEKALLDRSLIFGDGNPKFLGITHELDHCRLIVSAERLCKQIAQTTVNLFEVDTSKARHKVKCHRLGRRLLTLARGEFFDLQNLYPEHHFNPACEALLSVKQGENLWHLAGALDHLNNPELGPAVDILNTFVDDLRAKINSKEFKRERASIQRRCNKNLQGLHSYLKAVFAAPGCSALIGIRIDLGYKAGHVLDACANALPYEEVQAHRKAMTKYIKKYLGDAYAGYVCKLEYGLLKKYHFHWFILIKKSHLRRDILIAKALGEHWQAVITEGMGVYFNCNMQKDSYRDRCIGELQHDDPNIWKGLDQLATYLTKPEYHLRKAGPAEDRTLWRGKVPKTRTTRAGRKRRSVCQPVSKSGAAGGHTSSQKTHRRLPSASPQPADL